MLSSLRQGHRVQYENTRRSEARPPNRFATLEQKKTPARSRFRNQAVLHSSMRDAYEMLSACSIILRDGSVTTCSLNRAKRKHAAGQIGKAYAAQLRGGWPHPARPACPASRITREAQASSWHTFHAGRRLNRLRAISSTTGATGPYRQRSMHLDGTVLAPQTCIPGKLLGTHKTQPPARF